MDDDLNTSQALASLFEFARGINRIMDQQGLSLEDRTKVQEALSAVNSVLDIMDLEPPGVNQNMETLIKERELARKTKDWAKADRLREQLKELGINVIDTREGTIWRRE
jgi:cysteinyl-tRNA synthetase